MGAKVEGERYKPGYYATGDLNVDANGWRSPYHEEKTSNGQLYNGFMAKPATGYSEYDKEMLKRTMLEHEAIFRQQVYELHRVYKIQRDLMKQYQNKEIYAYPILADASQANSPSQIPPNGANMIWQMQMPPVSATCRKARVAEHNDTNHSLKFLREGKQVSNIICFTPRYSDADLQKSVKAADGRFASNSQFIYQGQNSSVGWFARSPLEASAINNFARLDRPHHSSLATLAAPVSIPHIDHPSVASPMGSCTVDPRSSVINNAAFQSIRSFNGSSTVNPHTSLSVMTHSIGTLIHNQKKIYNFHGRYPGLPLDTFSALRSRHQVAISSDLEQNNSLMFEHSARQSHEDPHFANGKGTHNFNLNEALPDGQEDVPAEQDGRCVGSLQHSKNEESIFGIPWLKCKSTCADPTGLERPGKVLSHSNGTATEMKHNKDMAGATLTFCNLSDSASTSVGCGIKKDGASEDSTARTRLACNKTQRSARCLPLSCQKHVPRDGQATEGVITKSGVPIRNFIGLNDDVPNEDNSESSVVSHECHVASLQNNHAKRTFVIDLEVPACEEGAAWTSQECTPSGKLDASKEADTYFKSAIAAAENIVALSMDVPTTADTPDDLLQWFAELAVSSIGHHSEQAEVQDCINNSSDDGLDSFESLTLKLEETKIDEYWSRPQAPAVTNDEQTVSTVNLLSKPKRGQQRRRRQKRDFQKDILPGLSTLSRPEILEDIQFVEALVQASGGSWESSLTRRGRYGGRTRGRKPRKNLSVTVEEEAQVSPSAKPDAVDLEADDKGMIGWGRTTRRCRRPRCPSGNNIAAAS